MTAVERPPAQQRSRDPRALLDGALAGDRGSLARLISLVERGGPAGRTVSELTFPLSGNAYTVGITGAPGSGKSTLTNRLIGELRTVHDLPVAVVAIDPSSPFSGGAILGDRVRMQDHALDSGVFIRSMATRGHLGGLAVAVPEAIRVLDATGWPLVLVETVGVGQVEVEVAGTCDTTVVVLNPGWGDSVQANKAGLLEIADIFVVNKADRPGLREARRDLSQMLMMSAATSWTPPIVATIASAGEGIHELWEAVSAHRSHLEEDDLLVAKRSGRLEEEVRSIVASQMLDAMRSLGNGSVYSGLMASLAGRRTHPYDVADELLLRLAESIAAETGDNAADQGRQA